MTSLFSLQGEELGIRGPTWREDGVWGKLHASPGPARWGLVSASPLLRAVLLTLNPFQDRGNHERAALC